MTENYIISVDMGGTKILAAALNTEKGIINRVKKATKLSGVKDSYVKEIARVIIETVEESGLSSRQIKAVSLGFPGAVNPETGIIALSPNLGLKNYPVKERLEKLIPFPVLLENDVNLGALGINRFGLGKAAKNMLVVFIGTGIGGAIIINGKIYRGSTFSAGEIGHMVVQENGPLCGCGNRGCFEAVASRTAVARNIKKDLKTEKSVLKDVVPKGGKIKSKALAAAIKANDKIVVHRISEACNTIGMVLASTTNLMNFDAIILGGGVVEALSGFMLPQIKESFNKHIMKNLAKKVRILPTKLGDDAALYGGIPLAEEFLGIKV